MEPTTKRYHETIDKVFHSKRKAIQIGSIDPLLYVGEDGSVFEISKCQSNPLFQKYQLRVPSDDESDYETCKECGHIHNELAHRIHVDIKTSIDVISEHFGKAKVMEPI